MSSFLCCGRVVEVPLVPCHARRNGFKLTNSFRHRQTKPPARMRDMSVSNEAHGKDFDFANAMDFSHLGFKGVSETFAVVHLHVNLHKL